MGKTWHKLCAKFPKAIHKLLPMVLVEKGTNWSIAGKGGIIKKVIAAIVNHANYDISSPIFFSIPQHRNGSKSHLKNTHPNQNWISHMYASHL
jgi:hypothetical protein